MIRIPEWLETEAQSKTELTLVKALTPETDDTRHFGKSTQASDRAIAIEYAIRDVVAGISEMRRVGQIERLCPELQFESLLDLELTEQAEVPICQAWTAHRIVSRISETRLRHRSKRQRIEESHSTACCAQLRDNRINLIR